MLSAMDLVLATNNRHKAEEFRRIFADHRVLVPADLGLAFSYREEGGTFLANALGKASALHRLCRCPVLADDSGLAVESLGGAPGVRSARYGSENGVETDEGRYRHLLDRMEKEKKRDSSFICCLVLMWSPQRFWVVQEIFPGVITREPSGQGGFGYDPVFFVPESGKTVAELTDEEKDRLSHRGRAARRILALLDS